jgi:hypothetical protein
LKGDAFADLPKRASNDPIAQSDINHTVASGDPEAISAQASSYRMGSISIVSKDTHFPLPLKFCRPGERLRPLPDVYGIVGPLTIELTD